MRVSGYLLVQLAEGCIVCWWLRSCWAAGVRHSPSVPPNALVCTTDAVMALVPGKNAVVIACIVLLYGCKFVVLSTAWFRVNVSECCWKSFDDIKMHIK